MKWRLGIVALIFAVAAMLPMHPASTWSAPVSGGDSLIDARRATSDAAAQLSLLTAGTSQLVKGVDQLDEGKTALTDAIAQARAGAQELSGGMVQLQAGTGQLGSGATQLADSVGQVVDQVAGFEAIRGQVVAAIDRALESTKDSRDPDVVASRDSLKALREQAATAQIPADAVAKMNQLRDGSRDLANQLAVPGYAYHDGIYTATNGAASLASGLAELEGKVGEASGGIAQLVDGASKLDNLANQSASKVSAVRAALPVAVAAGTGAAGAGAGVDGAAAEVAGASDVARPSLSPLAAMLLAALAVLSGVALAAAGWLAARGRVWILGTGTACIAAAGAALAWVLGSHLGAAPLAGIAISMALGVLASAGITQVLAGVFGPAAGLGIAGVLAVAQTGLVGWVWRQAATTSLEGAWVTASQVFPMHWATAAIAACANAADYRLVVSGLLLSLTVAAAGLAGVRRSVPTW
ncbi:hypothetical protein [Corynebacterium bouchesdurhonense]|uniref:hypothetical protein n=1 Tax=Corynebacterium bouchesdurhonense TaxID=1720192 RepID=UPI00098F803E|nr:hypothetical protein [Corynebacterium bouchesdurhonense]